MKNVQQDLKCLVTNCSRKYAAKGYCHFHYNRWKRHGDPTVTKAPTWGVDMSDLVCVVETCNKPVHVKINQLCKTHYYRHHRYGDAATVRRNNGEGSTFEERFWSRVALTADEDRCWEWKGFRNNKRKGYGAVYFQGKTRPTHVVAYALIHGHLPDQFGLHSCDNPPCVNPKHIRNGTNQDNSNDKVARNRQARGRMLPQTKLDADKVREIRARRANGESCRSLAQEYGVWPGIISAVELRRSWRHVD